MPTPHTPTPTPTPTFPSWCHATIAAFIFAIQNCLGILESLEGALDLESGGTCVRFFSVVHRQGHGLLLPPV